MRPAPMTMTAGLDDSGRRLDRILRVALPALPLSAIYRMLRDGRVKLNGRKADGSKRVAEGDQISVELAAGAKPRSDHAAMPTDPSFAGLFAKAIVIETPDLAVIDKPRGALTHGPGGVDEWAKAYFAARMGSSLAFTPAPLHRLDRNTSGALAVSASARGAAAFSAALRGGIIGKVYLALLEGELERDDIWEDRLSRDGESGKSSVSGTGDRAVASVRPIISRGGFTLAEIVLDTGRTHQIRAQASAHGHPLAGDRKYGGSRFGAHQSEAKKEAVGSGYVLHCARLDIPAGVAGIEAVSARVALPAEAKRSIDGAMGDSAADEAELALDSKAPRRYPT